LERDRIFSDEITRDAARSDLEVIPVDGTQTVASLVVDLASRFDLHGDP
jgi:hypothetical protein